LKEVAPSAGEISEEVVMRRFFVVLTVVAFAAFGCSDGATTDDGEPSPTTSSLQTITTTSSTTKVSTSTTADLYPHREEALALAEAFLDTFSAFDQEAMNALISESSTREWSVYYLGWSQGSGYKVIDREACVFHEGGTTGKVTCAVTYEDDIMEAIGLEGPIAGVFTMYSNDVGIAAVEVAWDPPSEYTEAVAWVFEIYPQLKDNKQECWAFFNGGPTQAACATAIVAALEGHPDP
jgi:hypothetical protein